MRGYHPDRMVGVLTRLVSIAHFGLLFLAVLLLLGLPVLKGVVGDHPEWVIGLTVPVASLDSDATVVTRWGDARLEVEDMRGSLRLPLGILPWWLFAVLWTYTAAAMGLTLLFLHNLRRIFQRARAGEPFDATNALRLRWLGFLSLGLALLIGVAELVATQLVRGSVLSERVAVQLGISVDMSLVFLGLILLSLAEVFRRGAELEEEHSLTV